MGATGEPHCLSDALFFVSVGVLAACGLDDRTEEDRRRCGLITRRSIRRGWSRAWLRRRLHRDRAGRTSKKRRRIGIAVPAQVSRQPLQHAKAALAVFALEP